ncbi:hypothetical protein BC830DRAFT_1150636 [Chytriomyces sp. MP71]|nr:hypothetical protein BC830DRAFT_1150636 [Chytriomyces sp. MP71]
MMASHASGLAEDLESLLLSGGGSGVSVAEGVLGWTRRSNANSSDAALLHKCLPRICILLFGATAPASSSSSSSIPENRKSGLIHTPSAQTNALFSTLLAPDGPLLRLLLRADPSLKYQVDIEALPAPTRTLLAGITQSNVSHVQHASLPFLYHNRVAPGNATSPNPKVMLNMFEFFMFSFAHVAISTAPVIESRLRGGSSRSTSFQSSQLASAANLSGYLPQNILHASNLGHQKPAQPAFVALKPVQTSFKFANLDDVYFSLVKAYLEFLFPLDAPADEAGSGLFQEDADPSGLRRRMGGGNKVEASVPVSTKSASSIASILNWGELQGMDLGTRISVSQFVLSLFTELWLCQNDYTETVFNEAKFSRPHTIQLQSIHILVSHITSLNLKSVFLQANPAMHTPRTHAPFSRAYADLVATSYATLQKPLYTFLRLGFKFGELSEGFGLLVDVWITWLTPWRREEKGKDSKAEKGGVDVSLEWVPFISQNFLFYSRLLRNYTERAIQFDLFAATRPTDLTRNSNLPSPVPAGNGQPAPAPGVSKTKSLFNTLDRVFQLYTRTPQLLPVLRVLDSLLCNSGPHAASTFGFTSVPQLSPAARLGSRSRTNSGASLGVPAVTSGSGDWMDRVGGGDVVGMWMRNRIVEFEGRVDYQSVFGGAKTGVAGGDGPGLVLARQMLHNTYTTINRLNTYLPVEMLQAKERASSSPSSPSSALADKKKGGFPAAPSDWSDMSAVNHYIWMVVVYLGTVLHTLLLSSARIADKEREAKMHQALQQSVNKLYTLANHTVNVFHVSEEERAAVEASVAGATGSGIEGGLLLGDEDEEDVVATEVVPGVLTPDVFRNDPVRLTAAGREQVKRGMRKSDPRSVPVRGQVGRKLVMSYEFEWVVKVAGWLADLFEECVSYFCRSGGAYMRCSFSVGNKQYPALRERAVWLPKNAGLRWLRFFAAKQNLVFSAVLYVVSYVQPQGSRNPYQEYARKRNFEGGDRRYQ